MRWVRWAVTASFLAAAAALPGAASAAIIVASTGPSAAKFPVGKKLDDAGRVTLQTGDSVTVLDARGTKVMRGPGNFAVSQPGRPLPNPAYAVFTRRDANRARAGALRTGEDGKPLSPNLWLIDIAKSGTRCVTAPNAIQLWRVDVGKPARYRILLPNGSFGSVAFAKGSNLAAWDSIKAPVRDGAAFSLSQEGGSASVAVTFAVVNNPPSDAEGLALALIARGCATQLDLLTQALAISRF